MATYADARQHIRSGDLIAVRGANWFSRAISLKTRSEFTHVGIAWWQKYDFADPGLFIAESLVESGVTKTAASSYGPFVWLTKPDGLVWNGPAERFIADRVLHTPYDYWSIARALFGIRMRDDMRMTCNEFAAAVSQHLGFQFVDEIPQDPGALVNHWLAAGGTITEVE